MFKILKQDKNNIMVEAHGKIDTDDYTNFLPTVEAIVQTFDKVNCVVDLTNVESISSAAMLDEIKLSYRFRDNVGRYAIINPSPTLNELISIVGALNKGKIKTFAKGEQERAWQWICKG